MTTRDGTPKHPARFSQGIVNLAGLWIDRHMPEGMVVILDPFAGVGGVHKLYFPGRFETFGVEIEQVWADAHPRNEQGNALEMRFGKHTIDVIFTSPTYANRLADKHKVGAGRGEKKPWVRRSYTHDLREATGNPDAELHPKNSGRFQWGHEYRGFHEDFFTEANRVLRPGGIFILNVSDHVRAGEVIPVCKWWEALFAGWGWKCIERQPIETRRLRYGQNHAARVDHEMMYCFRKPA